MWKDRNHIYIQRSCNDKKSWHTLTTFLWSSAKNPFGDTKVPFCAQYSTVFKVMLSYHHVDATGQKLLPFCIKLFSKILFDYYNSDRYCKSLGFFFFQFLSYSRMSRFDTFLCQLHRKFLTPLVFGIFDREQVLRKRS